MRGYALVSRSVVLVSALAAVALTAAGTGSTAGSAQTRWVITDLGRDCSLAAINDRGQIVGQCFRGGKSRAFVWRNGKTTDLGTLEADLQAEPYAINAAGQIVGRCVRYGGSGIGSGSVVKSVAFLWENGRMIKLASLGGKVAQAEAINDRGQIIGESQTKSGQWRAVLWEKGHVTPLGIVDEVVAINNQGQIAGNTRRYGFGQAMLWENGRARNLGTLGGETGAAAINDRGQIVGSSATATHSASHAFLWQKGKMTDLGTLQAASRESVALAINESGQIVGYSHNPRTGDDDLFIWERGRMTGLGTFGGAHPVLGAPPGRWVAAINDRGQIIVNTDAGANVSVQQRALVWERGKLTALGTLGGSVTDAFAINDRGQIIGSSTTKTGSHLHAVLWTPKTR